MNITLEEFQKAEIRIGKIVSAEKVESSDRLLKLVVDLGDEKRQVISGIAESYPEPENLVGRSVPLIANLEPRVIRGFESRGMILVATKDGGVSLLHPDQEVSPGSAVR